MPTLSHRSPASLRRAAAILPLACLLGCSTVTAEREASYLHALTHTGPVTLDVRTHNGRVAVEAAPGLQALEITAQHRAAGRDKAEAESRLAQFDVSIEEQPDGIVVVRPMIPEPRQGNDMVALQIRVPDLGAARVKTHNGRVEVAGATAPSRLETHNGRVTAIRCTAPLEIETHNGRITVQDSSGHLTAETHNGRITIESHDGGVVAESSNGRIEAGLQEGCLEPFDLKTSNGRITVVVPAAWQGEVEASSGNGSLYQLAQGKTIRKVRGKATFALGGARDTPAEEHSKAHSGNGSIRIEQR